MFLISFFNLFSLFPIPIFLEFSGPITIKTWFYLIWSPSPFCINIFYLFSKPRSLLHRSLIDSLLHFRQRKFSAILRQPQKNSFFKIDIPYNIVKIYPPSLKVSTLDDDEQWTYADTATVTWHVMKFSQWIETGQPWRFRARGEGVWYLCWRLHNRCSRRCAAAMQSHFRRLVHQNMV